MNQDDDDPQPDAFSTLYDPLGGLRQRYFSRLSWKQRVMLFVAFWVVVIGIIVAVAVHEM